VEVAIETKDITECIKYAMHQTIPVKLAHNNQFNVPGWNDYVQDRFGASRATFLDWVFHGRPRFGAVYV
jgi:hypothetical protein